MGEDEELKEQYKKFPNGTYRYTGTELGDTRIIEIRDGNIIVKKGY